ncbi:large conductance mechanosensitive channel protein MscL [Vagococcus hydrophili]|uniref:Large-conductance mechanosensitive channel n=1 Tax=Vagococcus hydrophili TaxID=2714947 RepID=A0A6G8AXH0_9ENTE|nr:large conductance mechanosensitive channel protein MscL [Vagococcus hydrophili]QIL49754.1 large conductance mechanosensitive channel protein MscL [Vagococcus hydrophili]
MLKEFKEFISRGSVLDLAVGVIIGGAFTSIVTALTANIITPLINLVIKWITKSKDMKDATKGMILDVNGVKFDYGSVISAVITFLITAFVLFLIIKAVNKANKIVPKKEEEVEEEEVEPETSEAILNDIRDLLKAQQENNNKNTPDK